MPSESRVSDGIFTKAHQPEEGEERIVGGVQRLAKIKKPYPTAT
ncbi:hypothetical protein [Neisseria meningitidis]|nr:hypothetical protein [Neisseria meningitidis]